MVVMPGGTATELNVCSHKTKGIGVSYHVPILIPDHQTVSIYRVFFTGWRFEQVHFVCAGQVVIAIRYHVTAASKGRHICHTFALVQSHSHTCVGFEIIMHNFSRIAPFYVMPCMIQYGHPVFLTIGVVKPGCGHTSSCNFCHCMIGHFQLTQFHTTLTRGCGISSHTTDVQTLVPAKQSGIFESHKCPKRFLIKSRGVDLLTGLD